MFELTHSEETSLCHCPDELLNEEGKSLKQSIIQKRKANRLERNRAYSAIKRKKNKITNKLDTPLQKEDTPIQKKDIPIQKEDV